MFARYLPTALLYGAVGFLIGIAASANEFVSKLHAHFSLAAIAIFLVAGLVVLIGAAKNYPRLISVAFSVLLLLLGITLGSIRFISHAVYWNNQRASVSLGKIENIKAEVASLSEPLKNGRQKVKVIDDRGYRLLIYLRDYYQALLPGDKVELKGEVVLPQPIEDFDWPAYLLEQGISAVVYKARLNGYKQGSWSVKRTLAKTRLAMRDKLQALLPAPHSGILIAMLTGERAGISERTRSLFARSGISHIIAISGLHMGIIGGILLLLFRFGGAPRRLIVMLTALALAGYALFVGLRPSTVRAAAMGSIGLWALTSGFHHNQLRVLVWVAVGLLVWNPFLLLNDIGFQLSFLAVAGILIFWPVLNNFLLSILPWALIRTLVAFTLSAQAATLPLTISQFGIISFVSPLVNLIVLPLLPFIMAGGFVILILDYVFRPIAVFVGWIERGLIEIMLFTSALAGRLEFSFWEKDFDIALTTALSAALLAGAALSLWLMRWKLSPYAVWKTAVEKLKREL